MPKYSRLEAEISAMQRNSSTYCDQPEDLEDFAKWLMVSFGYFQQGFTFCMRKFSST